LNRLSVAAVCLIVMAFSACVAPSAAGAATPAQTDVMFLFDTSGSMSGALDEAKEEIKTVINQISASVPDAAFGVANVEDYPGYNEGSLTETKTEAEYEEDPEKPWLLDQPVTTEQSKAFEAIEALSGPNVAHGGGDAPEAYGRALWETDTNPNVGWRPGARHLIVLIADQVPHNPNVDEGIPEEFWTEPSPWNTGEEQAGRWGIPGTQLKEGETLDFDNVLHQLASDGKPLETVDYHDTGGDYIHYWEHWAALAGGQAFEANEGGHELAGKLISVVEHAPEDTACATSAVPITPSPDPPSNLPTALTPRFLQPGSTVVLTPPTGSEFCIGQWPDLGGSVVSNFEEGTTSKLVFHVPPTAANGLALTNLFLFPGVQQSFQVDNFRYPWGFSIENHAGNGSAVDSTSGVSYDEHISIGSQDIDSVFKEIGPPGNEVYEWVKAEAEKELHSGLCYGFSLLSRSLYDDSHGGHESLSYANSTDFTLGPGSEAYPLSESSSGAHALTHALLRASISQLSPEARLGWHSVTSSASTETELDSAFRRGQPAILIIKYIHEGHHEGHALLAFNYQKTANGLAIDVVDPNLPWNPNQPSSDYEMMQLNVNANGMWNYNGTFIIGSPFSSSISGSSGSLYIAPEPRSPGGLTLWYNSAAPVDTVVSPAGGTAGVSISYSAQPGHGIPDDVREGEEVDDATDDQFLIPPRRRLITITQDANVSPQEKTYVAGHDFLDVADTAHGVAQETVETHTGTISMPRATKDDMLSVTNLTHGAQRTVTATFEGDIVKPTLDVSRSGRVVLTTGGGTGQVSIDFATYMPNGELARARSERLSLDGHVRIHRHTPKIKRRRHKRSRRAKRPRARPPSASRG
jgi:hypothetical protein